MYLYDWVYRNVRTIRTHLVSPRLSWSLSLYLYLVSNIHVHMYIKHMYK